MTPCKLLIDECVNRLSLTHDAGARNEILSELQAMYYRLCASVTLRHMRRTINKTFTSSDTNGLYLPSDLAAVLSVVDHTNDVIYWRIEEQDKDLNDGRDHWYFRELATDELEAGTKADVSRGSTAITFDPTISTDYDGEYIRFSEIPGCFLLGASNVLASAWQGSRLSNVYCAIRPAWTKRLCILNDAGEPDGATVTVHYRQFPTPLLREEQVPLISQPRILVLDVLINRLTHQKTQRSKTEPIIEERAELYSRLLQTDGATPRRTPRDKIGRRMKFGRRR